MGLHGMYVGRAARSNRSAVMKYNLHNTRWRQALTLRLENSRLRKGGAPKGSPCIVPAARGKKLIAAGRRQNIGVARKEEKEREEKGKKEREKKRNLKIFSLGLRPRPRA